MFIYEVPFADLEVGQKVLSATNWPGVISQVDRATESISITWCLQSHVKKTSISRLSNLTEKKPTIRLVKE